MLLGSESEGKEAEVAQPRIRTSPLVGGSAGAMEGKILMSGGKYFQIHCMTVVEKVQNVDVFKGAFADIRNRIILSHRRDFAHISYRDDISPVFSR